MITRYVEQSVNIGTKQVIMDLLNNGKSRSSSGDPEKVEFVAIGSSTPLAVEYGGTGANNAALLVSILVLFPNRHTMTGNLNIQSVISIFVPRTNLQQYNKQNGFRRLLPGSLFICGVGGWQREQSPDVGSTHKSLSEFPGLGCIASCR